MLSRIVIAVLLALVATTSATLPATAETAGSTQIHFPFVPDDGPTPVAYSYVDVTARLAHDGGAVPGATVRLQVLALSLRLRPPLRRLPLARQGQVNCPTRSSLS